MEISIPLPSIVPQRLEQCLNSLEKYSRYSHEIIAVFDQHEKVTDSEGGTARKRLKEMDSFSFSSKKHKIKISKSADYDPPLWSRLLSSEEHYNKYIVSLYAFGISQASHDWILTTADEDFVFLPDWDYHLLKHVDSKRKLKFTYHMRLVELRPKANVQSRSILEIPYQEPPRVSYIMSSTANRRKGQLMIEPINGRMNSGMHPLLVHRDLLLLAGKGKNLFESMCNLYKSISFEHDFENRFVELGIRKVCPQNAIIFHSRDKVVLDV